MDSGTIVAFLATLGLGGVLVELIRLASSRQKEKRERDRRCWHERDVALTRSRIIMEYAHDCRTRMIRWGHEEGSGPDDFRPIPDLPKLNTESST